MSSALLKLIRRFLVALPSIQVRASELLERTEGALGQRNEIVHSLWPNPGDVKAFRHRPLPKNKREFENVWMGAVEIEVSDIRQLIRTLAELVTELDDFRGRVSSGRAGM